MAILVAAPSFEVSDRVSGIAPEGWERVPIPDDIPNRELTVAMFVRGPDASAFEVKAGEKFCGRLLISETGPSTVGEATNLLTTSFGKPEKLEALTVAGRPHVRASYRNLRNDEGIMLRQTIVLLPHSVSAKMALYVESEDCALSDLGPSLASLRNLDPRTPKEPKVDDLEEGVWSSLGWIGSVAVFVVLLCGTLLFVRYKIESRPKL